MRRNLRTPRSLRVASGAIAMGSIVGVLAALPVRPAAAALPNRCDVTPPVAAGSHSTYALGPDATLWDWGLNQFGELGNGSSGTTRLTPLHVTGFGSIVTVAAGSSHVLALKADETVWAWGHNRNGPLGDGTTISRNRPRQIHGLNEVTNIAAGYETSFAITRDGTVWAWGRNDEGQLGDGTLVSRYVPKQISALTGVSDIAAGARFTLALKSNGTILSFGRNNSGVLGRGTLSGVYPTPGLISGFSGVTAISASLGGHAAALKSDGTVWSWGFGAMGQLGNNGWNDSITPVQASGLSGVTAISTGGFFSLALKSNGTLWSWGQNLYGELGNTSAGTYRATPIQVSGLASAKVPYAGGNHSIALDPNGRTWTWGGNWYGQIGDGTTTHRLTPFQITAFTQVIPTAPTQVEGVAGERLAYLSWENENSVATQYVVTPYLGGLALSSLPSSDAIASHAVRNLDIGKTYEFTVAGYNCLGQGPASARSNRIVPTDVPLGDAGFKLESTRLSDRMSVHVNAFTGNLKVHERDLSIKGTGLDLSIERFYNNRATATSLFGNGWTTTVGNDVRLEFLDAGSLLFHGPGGYGVGFGRNDDGTYSAPSGVDAKMVKNANNTYTLTWNGTGEVWQFDSSGRVVSRADRNANTISYVYNGPGGKLSQVSDTQSRLTTLAYGTNGLVETITDPASRISSYSYDTAQNLITYTDPAGGITRFTYDASNNLTEITTPAGRRTAFTYDASRRVTQVRRRPVSSFLTALSFTYLVERTEVTDGNGKKTVYSFDPAGRTTRVTDALGNTTGLGYTSGSNVASQHTIGGSGYSYGYNGGNGLTSMQGATGAKYELAYTDPAHPDLPTTLTDPQGNVLTAAYDAPGNVRSLTNQLPTQNRVELAYDAKGMTTSSKDPNGNQTNYTYDVKGNLIGVVPPAPLGDVGVSYDNISRAITVTDGKDQTTGYTYDALDRLTKTTNPDGTTVTYAYDGDGNMTQMTDLAGTTTMIHDGMGRLTSRTTPDGKQATYTYDVVGNMLSLRLADLTVDYDYNAVNLPVEITPALSAPLGTAPVPGTITAGYDANYNRTSLDYPQGLTVTTTYDTSDRASSTAVVKDSQTLYSVSYGHTNPATSKDTALRYEATEFDERVFSGYSTQSTYTYDKLNRLTKAVVADHRTDFRPINGGFTMHDYEYNYTYDGAGNRLASALEHTTNDPPAGTDTKTSTSRFNAANQITDTDGVPYSHDANGNMLAGRRGTHAYNATDQTVSTATSEGLAAFTYRGQGQAERTTAGATAYAYSTLGLTAQTQGGLPTYFIRDPRGGLLSWVGQAGVYHYLLDGQGSVAGLTDAVGRVMARYSYDPFGQTRSVWTPTRILTGDPFVPVGSAVTPLLNSSHSEAIARANPYRYAGAYLDPTGLYHMGERYYDPALGRFTQQDPIHNPLDPKLWNRYVYVGNDPVNFVDPSGLWEWWEEFKCAVGKTIGMIPDLWSGARGNLGTVTNFEAAIGAGMVAWGAWSFVVLENAIILPLAAAFVGTLLVVDALGRAWASCDK